MKIDIIDIRLLHIAKTPQKRRWVEFGIYYGYPVCCIIDFCKKGYKMTEEQKLVHKNNGFVPCPECSKMILNGEATLRSLIKNRKCSKRFSKSA
jgi:hypothetical protein